MPKFAKKLFACLIIACLLLISYPQTFAQADISSCSASVAQHTVSPSSQINFLFTIDNTDGNDILWIKITRPSSNFTISSASPAGWSANTNPDSSTLTNGTLASGNSFSFYLITFTGPTQAPSANWTVQVSDDPSGANPFSCSGALDTEISGAAPDTTPPIISDVSLSGLTSTSITISWTTDEPATSTVYYGLDENYGFDKSDQTLKINHTITLTGLDPDTSYHFQVESSDSLGNTATSEDNTFLTPVAGFISTPMTGNVNNPNNSNTSPLNYNVQKLVKPVEKIPPTVKLTSLFDKPFVATPIITGEAEDNLAIFLIEYSIDGGKNWLPVSKAVGIGEKKAFFEFKPMNLDDGNYKIVARATDTSGNQNSSKIDTLIIDRLPPIVGGGVISIGPQILKPDKNGVVTTVMGVDQKVTVSSVGGATQIIIRSVAGTSKSAPEGQLYALTQSTQTGLWSGVLSFSKEGLRDLIVEAIDGAGNKTKRDFGSVYVLPGGKVTGKDTGRPINQAKATLHYLEPDSNSWVVWNGSSYGQKNPQPTSKDGKFTFFVPKGRYYLDVSAPEYNTAVSNIFTADETMAIGANIVLDRAFKLGFGSWSVAIPSIQVNKIHINPKQTLSKISVKDNPSIDKLLPSFSLEKTNGERLNQVQLRGNPTLISFVSTWSPESQEQFQILDKMQKNPDIDIAPIAVMESTEKLASYKTISKLALEFFADPDGTTVSSFNYQSLPTHYFVSRRGVIKKVMVGVLSEKEILEGLGGL